jgi:hypothetical protein
MVVQGAGFSPEVLGLLTVYFLYCSLPKSNPGFACFSNYQQFFGVVPVGYNSQTRGILSCFQTAHLFCHQKNIKIHRIV